VIVRRDLLLARFVLFGLAVGFAELPADAWLVDYTRTLDYSIGGGQMIWRSPLWMPLAWEVVAVQFGYIGLRLWERFGWAGLLMIGLLGAINIPFYEEMARRIHDLIYAVVHHSRRIRDRARAYATCANFAARIVGCGDFRRNYRRIIDLCLLRRCILHCGSTYPVNLTVSRRPMNHRDCVAIVFARHLRPKTSRSSPLARSRMCFCFCGRFFPARLM
jgi:Domain of unknown function (DUF6989)